MPEVSKFSSAKRAEELLPSLGYAQLMGNLGRLTQLGVLDEGSLTGALAVARLIDRGRVLRSGLRPEEIKQALARYREGVAWRPVPAIELALEQAIVIVSESLAARASV